MKNKTPLNLSLIAGSLIFLFLLGLAGCQALPATQTATEETQAPLPGEPSQSDTLPVTETAAIAAVTASTAQVSEPDPAAIQAAWETSPHANTFILDPEGQNNTCARCHAPINWLPAMDELPESCFACKFELEPPPPTIAESEWTDVPCKICHKLDKKDNVQPEVVWLEIAPLDEYASVASPSELCLKCHAAMEIPGHATVEVSGAHAGYECTQCHSAHATSASCDTSGCHAEPTGPVPGHDEDHQAVSCVACHDAGGMEVGTEENTGLWTTYISRQTDTGAERFAFASHNVVLEAPCSRCHFADNPWGLTGSVPEP